MPTIDQLPAAASPSATDVLPIVQTVDGAKVTRQVSLSALAASLGAVTSGGGTILTSGAVGSGLTFAGDTLSADVASVAGMQGAVTASQIAAALALGGAATLNVGTTASTVAAGNDSRITGALQPAAIPAAAGEILGCSGTAGQAAAVAIGAGLTLSGGVLSATAASFPDPSTLPRTTDPIAIGLTGPCWYLLGDPTQTPFQGVLAWLSA